MKRILFLLFCFSMITAKAQRSTWNKTDRKYLCDTLNIFFAKIDDFTGGCKNQKLWDVNDPRLLGDTFAISISFKPESYAKTKAIWNKIGIPFAMRLFLNGIHEFPQFKAITLYSNCTDRDEVKMTYLIRDKMLVYYDDDKKKWITAVPPCCR